jgi:hypothetical protein
LLRWLYVGIIDRNYRWAHRSTSELHSSWDSPGIATLYAQWGVDPIAPPPGFDLEAFSAVLEITDPEDAQKIASEDLVGWLASMS